MKQHGANWPVDGFANWIGYQQTCTDNVTDGLVRRFFATVPGLAARPVETPLPPGFHWCLAPLAEPADRLGSDGHPALGLHLPPVPLPRRMWAGGDIAFHDGLAIGDEVTRVSTIKSIARKTGRSGELVFITVRHDLSTGRGPALVETQNIVYRDPPGNGAKQTQDPPPAVEAGETRWATDPVLLFRYSALTFNGHRIHYDHPYATGDEGYPGLVVHGPLMATLLAGLAEAELGRIRRFSFRGRAPLICGETMDLQCRPAGNGAELELRCAEDGRLVMTAQAE